MVKSTVLETARSTLERDLRGRFGPALEAALEHRGWWLAQWEQGAPHVLGLLAQDVQEAVHESTDPLWPACVEPTCPARLGHPLLIEPDLGPDPFWTCHRTGLPVAPVGQLPDGPVEQPGRP